jgi:hypothetical protein
MPLYCTNCRQELPGRLTAVMYFAAPKDCLCDECKQLSNPGLQATAEATRDATIEPEAAAPEPQRCSQ